MRRFALETIAVVATLCATPALAATVPVVVGGNANPFLAGQPNGTTCCGPDSAPAQSPLLVPIAVSGGMTFSFSATGITDGAGSGATAPDGANLFNMTNYGIGVAPANGVRVLGLVGVFLTDAVPDAATQPAALDFSGGLNFASLAPGIAQIFWIGDGLTGTGSGAIQQFLAPAGATRLFLGTVDGFEWQNNSGGYQVTVTTLANGVPEPATWVSMLLGLGLAGAALRSRRRHHALPSYH